MTYKIRMAVLLLAVMFLAPGAHFGPPAPAKAGLMSLATTPSQPASVTVPGAGEPVVVDSATSLNTRGWTQGVAAVSGSGDIASDVFAAYSLAVASAPVGCRLPVSLLAAIGQVESANLSGRHLDANHRVVPALLGPVLDGSPFLAVKDTDAGQWDGDLSWDRALGPLQLIPASWRAVGVDMDGDGVRDPQDIDDAAGGAMVYLCAESRDLGTDEGVWEAVLSYNHSNDYLATVLAWKAVYDRAALAQASSLPMFDAQALPSLAAPTDPIPAVTATSTRRPAKGLKSRRPTTTARPSASGSQPARPQPAASPTPGKPSASPEPQTPAPSDPPSSSPEPDPTPDPAPLPICPLPSPTDPAAPSELPTPDPTDPTAPVTGAPILDEDGDRCLPLVDPVTGEPIVSGGTGPGASQTQSAAPGTP